MTTKDRAALRRLGQSTRATKRIDDVFGDILLGTGEHTPELACLDVVSGDALATMVQELADCILVYTRVGRRGRVRAPQRVVHQHAVARQAVARTCPRAEANTQLSAFAL